MKNIDFIVDSCTSLRYFIPIVEAGNLRGINSNFFVLKNNKYNCPFDKRNFFHLENLSNLFKINLFNFERELLKKTESKVIFTIEGSKKEFLKYYDLKISLTTMTDYTVLYKKYVDYVDYVLFPSMFMASYYNDMKIYPIDGREAGGTLTNKNIYLGSTKYDIDIDNYTYGFDKLKNKKKILLFAPNLEDSKSYKLFQDIVKRLKINDNFIVIVKTRGKHPVQKKYQGHAYFEDCHWYPHTSMVLINESDIILTFGSTVTKECVMLNKPFINIDTKKFKHLDFLTSKSCIRIEIEKELNVNSIFDKINYLLDKKVDLDEFRKLRSNFLYEKEKTKVSDKLLDFCKSKF